MRGRFITVEGSEGVGKTTQLALMQCYLSAKRVPVISTREPGGTPLGEQIRRLLLTPRGNNNNRAEDSGVHDDIADDSELLLVFAARAEHVQKTIRPALRRGDWVLCDRFTDATYAYQGGGRGIAKTRIAALEDWVQGDLRPDLTLLFDAPVEEGLRRAGKRGGTDRFERETLAFFRRVRDAYLQLAAQHPQRYRIVDANRSITAVQAQVEHILQDLLEGRV